VREARWRSRVNHSSKRSSRDMIGSFSPNRQSMTPPARSRSRNSLWRLFPLSRGVNILFFINREKGTQRARSRRVCSAPVAQLRSLAPALGGAFGHGDLDVERVERLGVSSSLPASRPQWLHLDELDVPSSRDEVVRWKEDMGKSTWTRGTP
jgi:hypothetical protein